MRTEEKVYFSYPITTGSDFWFIVKGFQDDPKINEELKKNPTKSIYKSDLYSEELKSLMDKNIDSIKRPLERLKMKYSNYIDPGNLIQVMHGKGWSEDDYLEIDKYFIENKIDKIVLLGDWYYSLGCWKEVAISRGKNIPLIEGFECGEIALTYERIKHLGYIFETLIRALWGSECAELLKSINWYGMGVDYIA